MKLTVDVYSVCCTIGGEGGGRRRRKPGVSVSTHSDGSPLIPSLKQLSRLSCGRGPLTRYRKKGSDVAT